MVIRFLLLFLVPALLVNGQDLRRRRPANRRAMAQGSSVVSVEDEMEETEVSISLFRRRVIW
jgi:hypothetical protein